MLRMSQPAEFLDRIGMKSVHLLTSSTSGVTPMSLYHFGKANGIAMNLFTTDINDGVYYKCKKLDRRHEREVNILAH